MVLVFTFQPACYEVFVKWVLHGGFCQHLHDVFVLMRQDVEGCFAVVLVADCHLCICYVGKGIDKC